MLGTFLHDWKNAFQHHYCVLLYLQLIKGGPDPTTNGWQIMKASFTPHRACAPAAAEAHPSFFAYNFKETAREKQDRKLAKNDKRVQKIGPPPNNYKIHHVWISEIFTRGRWINVDPGTLWRHRFFVSPASHWKTAWLCHIICRICVVSLNRIRAD